MKQRQWHDADIDSGFYLLMQDLTIVFTKNTSFTFSYSHGAFVDLVNAQITGSSFWDDTPLEIKRAGYQADLLLRTLGTMQSSHIPTLKSYVEKLDDAPLSNFSTQLVTLLEDIRLEALVLKKRPGMKRDFATRNNMMKHYFYTQMRTNAVRGLALDELFCLMYLRLYAEGPNPDFSQATKTQRDQLETLTPLLLESFAANDTQTVTGIAKRIVSELEADYPDMQQSYFTFPIKNVERFSKSTLFDELTRTDPLANEDEEDVKEENNNYFEHRFSTWHRENENSDRKQNVLQFELDVGTKTSLMGGETRETMDGDQAMASVQGTSGKSEENDYSEMESLPEKAAEATASSESTAYGRENKHAVAIVRHAAAPSESDKELYAQFVESIELYRRRLASIIEHTLHHKRNAPNKRLLYGRLSRKLLPLIIENNPRVFYKKSFESKEVDAAFTLLVDCSASMHDKMEETKRGIVLFHEVLDQLRIPHAIVGFWEDANEGTDHYHPNYLHYVHRFHDAPQQHEGAKIMQLEPEEDNRDGFIIRQATEELVKRREKSKFLLVFTDGEPAAMNYDQNGIVDTNVAVTEARKKGIEVLGLFLANEEIGNQEEAMMKNIYGKEHLVIPYVSELPDQFAPLLKKLLLRGL